MYSRSRSREKMTSLRPRPVTATVTKPSWMQPEAIVGPRSASVESRGSTASLTSILDHDSYISLSGEEDEYDVPVLPEPRPRSSRPQSGKENRAPVKHHHGNTHSKHQQDLHNNTYNVVKQKPVGKKKIIRKFVESSVTDDTEAESPEPGMSPWEQWLITKVKEDREKRKLERQKKREETEKKKQEEMSKQRKQQAAEEKTKVWVEKKNFEERLKKKVDKQREKTEQMIVEEKKKLEQAKAQRKFDEWKEQKLEEERQRRRQEKQQSAEQQKQQKEKKIKAQQRFEEWCRKADSRAKPLPNSFGYTSGKLTGYHDTGAYPVPTFYNPMPWQPIHIPRQASDKKHKRRSKPKPKYAWNPDKYR